MKKSKNLNGKNVYQSGTCTICKNSKAVALQNQSKTKLCLKCFQIKFGLRGNQ